MLVPATTGSNDSNRLAETASLGLFAKKKATSATEKSGSAARRVIASETGMCENEALSEPKPTTKHNASAHLFSHAGPVILVLLILVALMGDSCLIRPVIKSNCPHTAAML